MTESSSELQLIRDVIGQYIEGIHSGNSSLLKKAFHPQAMMYGSSPNNITITPIGGLYSYVDASEPPSKTGELHKCTIKTIQLTGNAASVEMKEEAVFGHDYTNYFQLLKIDGAWMIVSKTYNAEKVLVPSVGAD